MMKRGGNGYADGLNLIEKVGAMLKRLGSASFRDFPGSGRVDIHHADQLRLFNRCIFLRMKLPKVTDTDHTDLDLIHLTSDPSLGLLDEMEEVLDFWEPRDLVLSNLFDCFLQCQA